MKFYDRQKELDTLRLLYDQAASQGRMTVLTGRRRIGKTLLAREFTQKIGHKFVYLFVAKKSEPLLCKEYVEEIKRTFDIPVIGDISRFKDIFSLLLEISRQQHFTLIVDEFQEFFNINSAVYSEVQDLWDRHHRESKLNLIFIGSVYSLMYKIFLDSGEPLFERADRLFHIKPFEVGVISEILADHGHDDPETLFHFFLFTGGVPRYIDILVSNSVFTYDQILNFMLDEYSPFINEGKHLLIEEFGKEYGTYFSILELLATGKTSRSEIESVLERPVGGYLDRLEHNYAIISKYKPIDARPNSRMQKYRIIDNFLNFWFRFIYRHRSAVESGNFGYIRQIVDRDYSTYSGRMLESFFHCLFGETRRYNRIGNYWEKGNRNEIDLVAVNDLEKKLVLAEIKLNKSKIRIEQLKQRARGLLNSYSAGFEVEYLALSLEDATTYLGA